MQCCKNTDLWSITSSITHMITYFNRLRLARRLASYRILVYPQHRNTSCVLTSLVSLNKWDFQNEYKLESKIQFDDTKIENEKRTHFKK